MFGYAHEQSNAINTWSHLCCGLIISQTWCISLNMKSFQRRNFQIVSDLIFTPKIDIYCTHDLSFHYVLVLLSIMLHKAHFEEYYGIVLFKFAAFFFCNHLISTTCVSLLSWTFPVLFSSDVSYCPVTIITALCAVGRLCWSCTSSHCDISPPVNM